MPAAKAAQLALLLPWTFSVRARGGPPPRGNVVVAAADPRLKTGPPGQSEMGSLLEVVEFKQT